jgi:hypothetical protein
MDRDQPPRSTGPTRLAALAARAETLMELRVHSMLPLLVRDPYVMLAFAARTTRTIMAGTLPTRRRSAIRGIGTSIATVVTCARPNARPRRRRYRCPSERSSTRTSRQHSKPIDRVRVAARR